MGPTTADTGPICAQLDEEMRLQDAGRFYELLKKLGVNIQGKTHTGQDPFGLEETMQFGEQVGDGNYEPPAHMHQLLPPQQDIAWKYGFPPDEQSSAHFTKWKILMAQIRSQQADCACSERFFNEW